MALLALFAGAAATHRRDLADATRRVVSLSPGWAGALAGIVVLGVLTDGFFASTVTPGLSVRRATMVQQAATAANNTVIGSGPVSTGLRIAMLRSWQVSDTSIGLTIVTLNLVASYAVWLVALGAAILGAAGAASSIVDRRVYVAVIAGATVVLGASTWLWWALLCRPGAARGLAVRGQRLLHAVRRRIPRLVDVDLVAIAERSRRDARLLIHAHGHRIVLASVLEQLAGVAAPVVVVRAFGIPSDVVSTTAIIVAYGLVRLGAALAPIPGGIGVTELGLATLLVRFGGPEPAVFAAVVTYRALTFLLPILTGGACFVLWRWRRRPLGATGAVAAVHGP